MTSFERCAVLFVDDDPRVLQGLRRMLHGERRNWTMRFAGGGREALAHLEREAFDAVVTDWRMPDLDGAELLARVMERHPHAARIVLSGDIDPAAGFQAVRCAHQFLAKPCDAEALKAALARAFALQRLIEDSRLKALLAKLETLPSQPALYTQLLSEIESPNSSFQKVGEVIARDAGMAAKILQLVNSAFFGLARRIGSPQEAVALLGYDTVKTLVLGVKIFAQFDAGRLLRLGLDALWEHSLAASQCARTISTAENLPRQAQTEAFTAGILHDVGKLILAQNFAERYADVLRCARTEGRPLCDLEADCFGASHAELGAYLMGLWGLDEAVVESIAHHHGRRQALPAGRVAAIVYAANVLEHLMSADSPDALATAVDPAMLGHLNIADRFHLWEQDCRRQRREESLRAA
jgi:putative nucleotidyltransferase with HDIG domain